MAGMTALRVLKGAGVFDHGDDYDEIVESSTKLSTGAAQAMSYTRKIHHGSKDASSSIIRISSMVMRISATPSWTKVSRSSPFRPACAASRLANVQFQRVSPGESNGVLENRPFRGPRMARC